jgi:hypothetical protein
MSRDFVTNVRVGGKNAENKLTRIGHNRDAKVICLQKNYFQGRWEGVNSKV